MEENGGGDGNSSVAELEVRVETLEGTAADHETRISAVEVDVSGMWRIYIVKNWTGSPSRSNVLYYHAVFGTKFGK